MSINNYLSIDKYKIKQIRVLFPLHKENLTAYFSPILGQYAIKNSEFIANFLLLFNILTANVFLPLLDPSAVEGSNSQLYSEELLIPLKVKIYKGGKFNLRIFKPSIGFLYSACFKKRRRFYKRLSGSLMVLRNYKKLYQLFLLNSGDSQNNSANEVIFYRQIRKSLYAQ